MSTEKRKRRDGKPAFGLEVLKACGFGFVLLWLVLLSLRSPAQTYKNPVIPGDFPDPSAIRVGNDFYATATTGGWSPHFPILHSRDLVNWKIIGSVFNKKPTWAKGDFWAPEIIQDNGRFFVYYTARRDEGKKGGTLCVAVAVSEKPDRDYQDKGPLVCQEAGSIDADHVRDENGKPFLIWKEDGNSRGQPTWLYAQELDENGIRLKGKAQKLLRNTEAWEGNVIEGAYVLRRDGWFYLFYSGNSCCGRQCNYALGVARSKTLLGKWEKDPANPILAENDAWQCPGHGSIVTTSDERDFLLYHAYRKNSVGFNVGREALLDEVVYKNGWPTIDVGHGPSKTAYSPFKNTVQRSTFANSSDEFDENVLAPIWSRPLSNLNSVRIGNGFLSLVPAEQRSGVQKQPEVVVAERTLSGDYTATARIDFSKAKPEEIAGVSIYSWRNRAVGISVGNGKIFTWLHDAEKQAEPENTHVPVNITTIQLRVRAENGEVFRFSYSVDGENWISVGDKIRIGNIDGARIALIYHGGTSNAGARFDWLRVEGN